MAEISQSLESTLARMDFGRGLKSELLMEDRSKPWVPYAQPLLDAVDLFESLGIDYALIGGIAAMYYGRSRFTEDVDFVAEPGHMLVLEQHPAEMEQHHFEPTCTHKLYHQSGVQVDLWKDEHSADIIERSREVELAGRRIRMIDPTDLAAMKLRAGRVKDDYDLSEMIRAGAIDEPTLRQRVSDSEFQYFMDIKQRG